MKRRLALLFVVLAALTGGTLSDDVTVVTPPISIDPGDFGGGPDDDSNN